MAEGNPRLFSSFLPCISSAMDRADTTPGSQSEGRPGDDDNPTNSESKAMDVPDAEKREMQVRDDPEKHQVLQDLTGVKSHSFKDPGDAELLMPCLHEPEISQQKLSDFFQKCKTTLQEKYGWKNSDRSVASSHKAKSSSSSASMNPLSTTVKVFSDVRGQTFGAHDAILEKVSKSTAMEITRDQQDCDVIMIFCPIRSRVGSDVEGAMRDIPGGKPAILVLMHHTRDVDYSTGMKRWSKKYPNIQLEVHVLFHETQQGLLECERNDQAAHQIQDALESYSEDKFRK